MDVQVHEIRDTRQVTLTRHERHETGEIHETRDPRHEMRETRHEIRDIRQETGDARHTRQETRDVRHATNETQRGHRIRDPGHGTRGNTSLGKRQIG